MAGNKHLVHSFHHLLIGGILIFKGAEKFHNHNLLGGLIFSFGVIILLCFVYFILKKVHSRSFTNMVHLFEAMACLFTAYIFYQDGKQYIQYFFLLAAVGFLVSIINSYKKRKPSAINY